MRTGNSEDFAQVFDRHFDNVYGYVAYRLAGDLEAAKDITQEVCLAALQALPNFRGDGSLLTWLRAIARNKVADHLRAQGSPAQRRFEDPTLHAAPGLSPKQDRAVLVSLVMRQLPGNYAELLEDKYLEDLSVKEIARQRKMSEKAVESALTRARDAFRQLFRRLKKSKED